MESLIPKDYSRCSQHPCTRSGQCARYLQVNIDEYNDESSLVTDFEPGDDCHFFISETEGLAKNRSANYMKLKG